MPTLRGLRRRGYTPASISATVKRQGVSKVSSTIDVKLLEYYIRDELNKTAPRVMAVLDPLKVVIENYPEGQVEELDAENNPEDPSAGSRKVPFTREIYIEREDFREDAPRKWFRLSPGREVRLKHAYYVRCTDVIRGKSGEVVELRCSYDPASRGGWTDDGRKVRGTLHWVSAAHGVPAEVRIYDLLFSKENPAEFEEGGSFVDNLNPDSLAIMTGCLVEPAMADPEPGVRYQFLRQGYFCVDPDSRPGKPVFNRTVTLRDSWARIERQINN
jgi:glutaminyl-tRNA synthetase